MFRVAHPTFPVFYAEFADLESFITVILLCMKKKFDNLLILAIYRSTHFFDSVTEVQVILVLEDLTESIKSVYLICNSADTRKNNLGYPTPI